MRRGCVFIVLSVLAAGCAGPSIQPGFESVDPQERTAALLDAARAGDQSATPELIVMLESSDPAERMLADGALRRLTGQDFGYRHFDPEWKRAEAADAWRRWWQEQQTPTSFAHRSQSEGGGAMEAP